MKQRLKLRPGILFSLFATSYLPLFFLIALRQLLEHRDFLHFGGLGEEAVKHFFVKFGFASLLGLVGLVGIVGTIYSLRNLRRSARTNGIPVMVEEVHNKNAESLGYLATYIIPFLFENYDGLYAVLAVSTLLVITFLIYRRSSLVVVNPMLTPFYSLYEVTFRNASANDAGKRWKGLIITKHQQVEEGVRLLVKDIGYRLFIAEHDNTRTGDTAA